MRKQGYRTFVSDSRIGDHSYTGWTTRERWTLDDGRSFMRLVGEGAFTHDCAEPTSTPIADPGQRQDLPMSVVLAAGLTERVPDGLLAVQQKRGGEKTYEQFSAYDVYGAGDPIPAGLLDDPRWARGHGWTVLRDGAHIDVSSGDHRRVTRARVTNRGGSPVISDEPDREARREYARAQRAELLKLGASEEQVRALFRAAGPGRAVAAYEWYLSAIAVLPARALRALIDGGDPEALHLLGDHDADRARRDGLLHVQYGLARQCAVLELYGLPAGFRRAGTLNCVLAGASSLMGERS